MDSLDYERRVAVARAAQAEREGTNQWPAQLERVLALAMDAIGEGTDEASCRQRADVISVANHCLWSA